MGGPFAPRAPRCATDLGLVFPWAARRSISALISPPSRTTMVESHIQIMKPITAPSEP